MNTYFENMVRIINDSICSIDDQSFEKLVEESLDTLKRKNKIIVSGLGKNVPVCEKFTGTMLSLGLEANFLHTNSAVHGDMGMVKHGDLLIILTKSGDTAESVYLADLIAEREGVKMWLITFNEVSSLTKKIGLENSLIIDMEHEGDMWDIVPNNSTTLNLMVLQGLAMELSQRLGQTLENDFTPNHPGGAIGAQLRNEK